MQGKVESSASYLKLHLRTEKLIKVLKQITMKKKKNHTQPNQPLNPCVHHTDSLSPLNPHMFTQEQNTLSLAHHQG